MQAPESSPPNHFTLRPELLLKSPLASSPSHPQTLRLTRSSRWHHEAYQVASPFAHFADKKTEAHGVSD